MSKFKVKDENRNWIELAKQSDLDNKQLSLPPIVDNKYLYVEDNELEWKEALSEATYYGSTSPTNQMIWCDTTSEPERTFDLYIESPEGATFTATKDEMSVPLIYQQVQIPNPDWVELPEGYTQLEYIQSSGTQYINTTYTNANATQYKAEIKFTPLEVGSGKVILGSEGPSATRKYTPSLVLNGYIYYYGNSSYATTITPVANTVYDLIMIQTDAGLTATFNGTTYTHTGGTNALGWVKPVYIFAYDSNGTANQYSKDKLYYCRLYDNNVEVRNFIPCKNSSNEIGLYDLVTNTFFGNNGTGTFTGGDEVSQYITANYYKGTLNKLGNWTITGVKGTQEVNKQFSFSWYRNQYKNIDFRYYLYNLGDECEDITGGWTNSGSGITRNTDNIYYDISATTSAYYGRIVTVNNISFNGHSTIKAEFYDISTYLTSTDRNVGYLIMEGSTIKANVQQQFTTQVDGQSCIVQYDVSSLNGNYKLEVGAFATYNPSGSWIKAKLKRVWLE